MNPCKQFGNYLKLAVRGESHAPRLEFELENFPAGFAIDRAELRAFMERRAPGRDGLSTARREPDEVEFRSGVVGDTTDGATICGIIANKDMRPGDYGAERTVPRPGHADFPQWVERGFIPTGGGENSGRLTAALCAVGGVCRQFLARRGISVAARIEQIHGSYDDFEGEILRARAAGDSVGGTVVCEVRGVAPGLGGALFGGVDNELAAAMFAIPGVKGVEFGDGFAATRMQGSEYNDAFTVADGEVRTVTNRQGGVLGGRTSGMPIVLRVALRPTPTIFKPQPSVDLKTMQPVECAMKGRHDPCIVRRAVPVVEAMAAFVVADLLIGNAAKVPRICLTLTGATLAEDVAQFQSQRYFTDLVELRADKLAPAERELAAEFPKLVPVPVVLTFRRKADGGDFDGDEAERVAFFKRVLAEPHGFAYVDFEDDFRHAELTDLAKAAGTKVIRSLHDFTGPVPDILARCRALRGETDEIPKIAFMPKCEADVERLFAETEGDRSFPRILCAMGALGLPSRTQAARTGSIWTYASVGGLGAIGHVTPFELVRKYNLRQA